MRIIPFLKVASRDLRIGAVMPSSRFAVRNILRFVPPDTKNILEYGPGDGVLTRQLLEQLPPDGRLLAIETNPTMCSEVSAISDSRLILIHGDATRASEYATEHGIENFDLVISGIPFSMLPPRVRQGTAKMTESLLSPSGTFLVYQTSPLMLPYLKNYFDVQVAFEPRNVPPYFIMCARKRGPNLFRT